MLNLRYFMQEIQRVYIDSSKKHPYTYNIIQYSSDICKSSTVHIYVLSFGEFQLQFVTAHKKMLL